MIKNALVMVVVVGACAQEEVPAGYQGVVELDERMLSFEVGGRVMAVTAQRGEMVDPSKVLATLDDSQARTAVTVREAEAKAAEERAKLVAAGGRSEDIRALEAQLRLRPADRL